MFPGQPHSPVAYSKIKLARQVQTMLLLEFFVYVEYGGQTFLLG